MPASRSRHPALAQQAIVKDLREKDEEECSTINGWKFFSQFKKNILLNIPYFGNPFHAYLFVKGLSHDSIEPEERYRQSNAWRQLTGKDKQFRAAVKERHDTRMDMPRQMMADLMGHATTRLAAILDDPAASDTAALKAIQMIFEQNAPRGTTDTPSGMTNYGPVTFNIKQAEEEAKNISPRIVEAKVVEETKSDYTGDELDEWEWDWTHEDQTPLGELEQEDV